MVLIVVGILAFATGVGIKSTPVSILGMILVGFGCITIGGGV